MKNFIVKESRSLVTIIYVIIFVILLIAMLKYFYLTNEDAWITYKYIRNLSGGFGLVENPFDETQEGASSLMHVLIVAAINAILGIDINIASKFVGIISVVVIVFVSNLILKKTIFNELPLVSRGGYYAISSVSFLAIIAASDYFLIWSTQGLETTLYSAVLVGLVYFLVLCASQEICYKRYVCVLSVGVFVAINTRPEAVALVPILFGFFVAKYIKKPGKESGANLVLYAIIVSVAISFLMLWKYLYFGDIKSNPSYVKLAVAEWGDGINNYFFKYFLDKGIAFTATALIALVAFVYSFKRLVIKGCCRLELILVTIFGIFLISAAVSYISAGDYMPNYRFIAPYYPLLVVFILLSPLLVFAYSKRFCYSLLCVFALILSYSALKYERLDYPYWSHYDFKNPNRLFKDFDNNYNKAVVEIGKIMEQYPNEYYALSEYGYVPFHLGEKFYGLDIMGLNQKELARSHKIYGLAEVFYANRDFILSKAPRVISTAGGIYRHGNEIKFSNGIAYFFKPYYESDFFKKFYHSAAEFPEGSPSDEFMHFVRKSEIPNVSEIFAKNKLNSEYLLYGFSFEDRQIWAGPLNRILITPRNTDHHMRLTGYVPDIAKYKGNKLVVKFKFNDDSIGDRVFYQETIAQSGPFNIYVPLNPAITLAGKPFLLTIESTKLIDAVDKRNLSFLFDSLVMQ